LVSIAPNALVVEIVLTYAHSRLSPLITNVAVVNQELCIQCGTCTEACPFDAIYEVVPARIKISRGGERMTYGYGRGFTGGFGLRGGAGFGFRGASPPWPYIGRGRGGLPRCWHPGLWGAAAYPAPIPYWSEPTGEEELKFFKDQADLLKRQLEDIESRIQELEKREQ